MAAQDVATAQTWQPAAVEQMRMSSATQSWCAPQARPPPAGKALQPNGSAAQMTKVPSAAHEVSRPGRQAEGSQVGPASIAAASAEPASSPPSAVAASEAAPSAGPAS